MRALAITGALIAFVSSLALFAHAAIAYRAPEARPVPDVNIVVAPGSLLAAAAATGPASFNEEGTIVIDASDGPASPYLLYTTYADGKPSIRTKRLVFPGQFNCQQKGLPCATPAGMPVAADERVRVTGIVRDDTVTVGSLVRE